MLLDPSVDRILSIEELQDAGDVPWHSQFSGAELREEIVPILQQRWNQFIGMNGPAELEDAERAAIEGEAYYALRKHRRREFWKRNEKIEEVWRKSGRLVCEVPGCEFDFEQVYGELGRMYAQVHHRRPLSEAEDVVETRLRDLAIVCANCHAMIHVGGKCRELNELFPRRR